MMKTSVIIGICFLCLLAACDTDTIYQEEQYKNVIYLLSDDENVFTESYTLNETNPVRYFSIGCGGSKPNDQEVVVTLEPDTILLQQYNKVNFDRDESKFARLLPTDRYEIESYIVTIPANPVDQYVKVPIKVRPHGLSPDSIYFIPLAIKNVSRYEVNEEKFNMLYRVTIENDYARQQTNTYYVKRGTEKSGNTTSSLSGTKIVQPLDKDKVRMFAGNLSQTQLSTIKDIQRYAIVVQIKEDNTVDITSYGTINVEMLDDNEYNRYDPKNLMTGREQRVLFLNYRYQTLNADGVTYSSWKEVRETLTRVNED